MGVVTIGAGGGGGIGSYVQQEEKTKEKLQTGYNCDIKNFEEDFEATKKLYEKEGGRQYYHVTQSFSPEDDLTAEKAHELGQELAKKNFAEKGFEVAVVTHIDQDHLHNHIVVNSVNFETGKKYKSKKHQLDQIKEHSNQLCRENDLNHSVVDHNKKRAKRITRGEYRIMQRGDISWKEQLRQVIDRERKNFDNMKEFTEHLKQEYDIKTRWSETSKTMSFKHPDIDKRVRGRTLGDNYKKGVLENEFRKREITKETRRRAEETIRETSWGSVEHDVQNQGDRIPEQSTNEIIGKIQREVQEIKERTAGIIGDDKGKSKQAGNRERDVKKKSKERSRHPIQTL